MVVDKAQNDIIQVAVTNGLLGVLAYYLIVVTIAVQFWRNRRDGWTAAMLAGQPNQHAAPALPGNPATLDPVPLTRVKVGVRYGRP